MAEATCPCCGSAIDGPLPADGLVDIPLEGHARTIVMALAERYPRATSMAMLVDACYGHDPNGGPDMPDRTVAQYLVRLRKTLPRYGWTIPKNEAGVGARTANYRLRPL